VEAEVCTQVVAELLVEVGGLAMIALFADQLRKVHPQLDDVRMGGAVL
jgi:hypothetical protein